MSLTMRAKRPLREPVREAPGPKVKNYITPAGLEHVVAIVGLDEVDVNRHYISWRSPLAKALMKARAGDRVVLHAPNKTEHLEILDVDYQEIPMDPFREPPGAESAPAGSS